LPPVSTGTPGLCQAIIDCIDQHCEEVRDKLKKCQEVQDETSCEEGIAKWGKWAECWLNFNTDNANTWPLETPNPFTRQNISNKLIAMLEEDTDPLTMYKIARAKELTQACLAGDYSQVGTSPYPPLPRPTYIFEDTAAIVGGP
jgi:hypothetical protein